MPASLTSRRDFLIEVGAVVGAAAVANSVAHAAQSAGAATRLQIVAALGDTLIPSGMGDPGYRDLEKYGLTEEVLKKLGALSDDDLLAFNAGAAFADDEKSFVQLDADARANYLTQIVDMKIPDKKLQAICERIYRAARFAVFTTYYQNFPEVVQRDAADVPIPVPGDTHQIINPNTKRLVTGWDQAGFDGPWSWAEEEARRVELQRLARSIGPEFQRFEG